MSTAIRDTEQGRRETFFRRSAEQSRAVVEQTYDFDCVPRLGPSIFNSETNARGTRGVLLQNGGGTGFIYTQIPVEHLKRYTDRGWSQVTGSHGEPMPTYRVHGPKGSVDCILLGAGKRIAGIPDNSNVRECLVHRDIFERTGHKNELSEEIAAQIAPPKPGVKSAEAPTIGGATKGKAS